MIRDEFLSEEDLDLKTMSDEELYAYWNAWLEQAQSTNDADAHTYSHGVFREEPRSDQRWFERRRPDGSMEPHVSVGEDGGILILDNGWVASYQDGKWINKIMFTHDQIAEFTPVEDQEEIYRLLAIAQEALGSSYKDIS